MILRSPALPPFPLALLGALAAGAVTPLAFAPFGLWPLQMATLALAFRMAAAQPSALRSAVVGWAYTFGWLACGVHWLYISMHHYGGMPGWMAALAVGLLAFYLGAYTALAFGIGTWLQRRWQLTPQVMLALVLPALWMLAEWLRGWVFTGFPWVSSGYAYSDGLLAGFAPVIGVYGLALVAALIAGSAAALSFARWPTAVAVVLLAAGFGLGNLAWTEASGKPLSVRLLQGNVPQEMKFVQEQQEATLALYYDMLTAQPADLIVTPETAIPILSTQLPPDFLVRLSTFAQQSHSSMLLGIPVSDGRHNYANSAIGLAADGTVSYRYDKHHLVPFGEFIPWGFRWFVDMMRIPLGDFTPGAVLQAPFGVGDQQVLPNICYEDLFGEEIAAQLAAGTKQATVLLNLSNIAWFGDSIALPQHLQISRLRALETGRPMLRATNTGMTAVIGANGQVQAQLPPFRRGTLSASVQGYRGLTPYSRLGNLPALALAFCLLAAAWLTARYRGKKAA